MSDFALVTGSAPPAALIDRYFRWSDRVRIVKELSQNFSWIMSRTDDPRLWDPARDHESGRIAFISGRLAFDEKDWAAAEELRLSGGLASRIILQLFNENPDKVSAKINGAGTAVVIDSRSQEAHFWNDPIGAYPVCVTEDDGHAFIGSHPDFLATLRKYHGQSLDLEHEAVEEFICTGAALPPKTYWKQIYSLRGGVWCVLRFGGEVRLQIKSYWRPSFEREPLLEDRREIVCLLSDAISNAVKRRTSARLGKVGVLLSAGADSRACVFGCEHRDQLRAYTYYDEPNPELVGAHSLSQAARVAHAALQRPPSYYVDHLSESIRLSGGMWSHESSHNYGMLLLGKIPEETILTGCYADYLLKGIAIDSNYISLAGRNLPLKRLAVQSAEWHHPHIHSLHCYSMVRERVSVGQSIGCGSLDPKQYLISEAKRTSPVWREPDAAGRLTLHRLVGWDPVYVDRDILEVSTRMHPRRKVNGIEFGMAVARVIGRAGAGVFNNNYGAPVGAGEIGRVVHFLWASAKRKLSKSYSGGAKSDRIGTVGSWPNYAEVFRRAEYVREHWDSELRRRIDSYPHVVEQILGQYSYNNALHDISLLLRTLTWTRWYDECARPILSWSAEGGIH